MKDYRTRYRHGQRKNRYSNRFGQTVSYKRISERTDYFHPAAVFNLNCSIFEVPGRMRLKEMSVKGFTMKLCIKNMVSTRCKLTVKSALELHGIPFQSIETGEVELKEDLTKEQHERLQKALLRSGLELVDEQKARLVQKIKEAIEELVHGDEEIPEVKISNYLSDKFHSEYTHMSKTFSEVKGVTIEHFLILQKIERAKELILYEDRSLTDIAYKLNYSSVAHLSSQFKKVTGLTATHFKELKANKNTAREGQRLA